MTALRTTRASLLMLAMLAMLVAARAAAGQGMDVPGCGTLLNAYGPYDYTNPEDVRDKLPIVEQYHFDHNVEQLKMHAHSSASLGADLDYTLRAFPNHHRALDTIGRYQLQSKQPIAPAAHYTAECYFDRAMAFAPNDGITRMVYGIYLTRKGDREGALQRYGEAVALMPDSAEAHYNLGLLYESMKRYDDALTEAHAAYARGFPLPGLRNKLVRAGVWRDPPPDAEPVADAPDAQATPPADVQTSSDAPQSPEAP
jgi:Flp pilus assembly protein TadD